MISPGADSASVRSAMRTWSRPDTWHCWWGAIQRSVPATGLTCADHRQPGWIVIRPIGAPQQDSPTPGASYHLQAPRWARRTKHAQMAGQCSDPRSVDHFVTSCPRQSLRVFRPLKLSFIHSLHYRAARQTHPPPQRPRHPHHPRHHRRNHQRTTPQPSRRLPNPTCPQAPTKPS